MATAADRYTMMLIEKSPQLVLVATVRYCLTRLLTSYSIASSEVFEALVKSSVKTNP